MKPIVVPDMFGLSEKKVRSQVFLSRRNLLTLLAKLDRVRTGDESACTIIKRDDKHPVYPQSMAMVSVTAVEDQEYYAHRRAGEMHPVDELTMFANEDRYSTIPEDFKSKLIALGEKWMSEEGRAELHDLLENS